MTEEKKASLNYRFSGYLPPLISLGNSSDAGYWCKPHVHPYYVNQPECWARPIYRSGGAKLFGNTVEQPPTENLSQLYTNLPLC